MQNKILGKIRPNISIDIVGAGISGLILGHYLKKAGGNFTIYEKSSRTGGIICTKKTEHGLVETAASSIIASDLMVELLRDLKLEIIEPTPRIKRYIHRKGELKSFPFYLHEFLSFFPKLLKKTSVSSNLTLNQFLNPLFGEQFCREVVSTAVRGIYAIDGDELDYQAIFPSTHGESYLTYFKNFIQLKKNDRKKTKLRTLSFKNGIQELVDKLSEELKSQIILNTDYELNQRHNVIFCTDAQTAGTILEKENPGLADLLKNIPYRSISTNTVFTKKPIPQLQQSFGLLSSSLNSYGILSNSETFSNRAINNFHSYTLIKPISNNNREEIITDLKNFSVFENDIQEIVTTNWERGIPRYNLKRREMIEKIYNKLNNENITGTLFFGNYVAGISLRDLVRIAHNFSKEQL